MPVYDRFTATLDRVPPAAYVIASEDTAVRRIVRHRLDHQRIFDLRRGRGAAVRRSSASSPEPLEN